MYARVRGCGDDVRWWRKTVWKRWKGLLGVMERSSGGVMERSSGGDEKVFRVMVKRPFGGWRKIIQIPLFW